MATENNLKFNTFINEVKEQIQSHTLPLFYHVRGKLYKPLGTGVFVKIDNHYYLLTAGHVVSNKDEYDQSYPIFIVTKGGLIETDGLKFEASHFGDVGVIFLPTPIAELLIYSTTPLLEGQIRTDTSDIGRAFQYCILGYPKTRVTIGDDQINANYQFFLTRAASDKAFFFNKKNRDDDIFMEWDQFWDLEGNRVKRERPEGMSGSGLWYIDNTANYSGQYRISYQLIGIMYEYRTYKHPILVGSPISGFIQSIRMLRANPQALKKFNLPD
ncbi:hypothetical protein [Dyadobacter psychrophilus]|uniref:Trypsin-like peptidase domain-containing protein n=1 Tax=Dyadobacter psychrophilus TaxID=651661 RepID=A0A1T5H045_9BACT|nr:hypothetical protein [Dyadobacter psychrophilus]SKC14077.1 hypothetical protein SAMN05660293_04722 [Dyadobacter psychrophilus]